MIQRSVITAIAGPPFPIRPNLSSLQRISRGYQSKHSWIGNTKFLDTLCAKLLMVRTMLQSTKTFDTKLVRYIEWSNVQPCVHHILPIWPHYGHFGPKNSHIWPYLAIGSPSCPKLVEHWLNMVEHRSPHLRWATWTPLHPPK